MRPFTYVRPQGPADATAAGQKPGAQYIAGGTTLVDLMRLDVMQPDSVIDVTGLPLGAIEPHDGGVRIGAMARNTDVAYHPLVASGYPVLAEALLSGASPRVAPFADVRSLGTLLQRAGFALPVVDLDRVTVRYGDMFGLMRDLRAMGWTNALVARTAFPAARHQRFSSDPASPYATSNRAGTFRS